MASPPYALTTRLLAGPMDDPRTGPPVPATDSGWLTVVRRDPPVLPEHLAPRFREALEPHWDIHSRDRERS